MADGSDSFRYHDRCAALPHPTANSRDPSHSGEPLAGVTLRGQYIAMRSSVPLCGLVEEQGSSWWGVPPARLVVFWGATSSGGRDTARLKGHAFKHGCRAPGTFVFGAWAWIDDCRITG